MQPINQNRGVLTALLSASIKTDSRGRYRIGSIPTGTFNVYASSVPGRTSAALESLAVSAGQVVQAPPIRLVKGGVVKGRLIDDATGRPALVGKDECVLIIAHGPARPWSGGGIERFPLNADGTFELRLPPGKSDVYVYGSGPFLARNSTQASATHNMQEIDVKEGGEYTVEFHVTRRVPMTKAPQKPIKNSPVPSSGAVNRPAPVMLAEAPTVSPKILDYHLEKDAVGGLCLGRDEVRFAGVEVALYILRDRDGSHELVGRTITNDEGQFVFRQVPNLKPREKPYLLSEESYLFVARKKGLATSEGTLRQRHDWIDLRMGPGVSMNGVVQDEQGNPIAGALVRGSSYPNYGVPEEAPSVRTNERGEFQIDDLPRFGACSVSHPDYLSEGLGDAKKNPVVATLRKASVVRGQVIDGETGRPVAGAHVTLQTLGYFGGGFAPRGRRANSHGLAATTDLNGNYKFRSLWPGAFNLSCTGGPDGVASASIEAFNVGRAKTVEVPPVRLAKGAIVAVRLISNDRDQDVSMGP
ncbi:MAG TPA: carboxypeptidase regulatory-like domain-containing protein, partial [Planctomycetaceae bacterium]|nr:carboxypeptidase regulatory-like domain-containing protein [Planctomycetaceae bacterium]